MDNRAAVYDDARAYSLRDRDLHPELIDDLGHVTRMRLACRAAENLMLTDDALARAGTNWATLQQKIRVWVASNGQHQYHADVQAFVDDGFDRKVHDLKNIRNILVGLISNKPWEVLVGQSIAAAILDANPNVGEGSLSDYLGAKIWRQIILPAR